MWVVADRFDCRQAYRIASIKLSYLTAFPLKTMTGHDRLDALVKSETSPGLVAAKTGYKNKCYLMSTYPAVRPRRDVDGEVMMIPEDFALDNNLPAPQGYGESKHVASSIIAKAAKEGLVVGATIMRVGQLAGTTEGKRLWNPKGKPLVVGV